MNPSILTSKAKARKKPRGFISAPNLVLIAYSTAFFPRVLLLIKFPSLINFLHFAAVPFVCFIVLLKAKSKDRAQIADSQILLGSLFFLLTVFFASALLNDVGVINVLLSYLMWTEPFLLLLAIVAIPMSPKVLTQFRKWVLGFAFFNVGFALIQKFVLRWDTCYCAPGGWADGDAIKGVFINQGAGHVLNGSVSATIGVYFFVVAKDRPFWMRALVAIAGVSNIQWSQANQVLLVMMLAFVVLALTKVKDPIKAVSYLIGITVFSYIFYWAIYNVEALWTFQTWIRPDLYGPDGEAARLKFSGIRIIVEHFHSPLNWLLGLGPGHTIDRLGGWMLRDFSSLLSPLGSTQSPVSEAVWAFMNSSWLGTGGSTLFSPFWGWAGMWGDVGFVGLGAYLLVCFIIWQRICRDVLSKYLMLTVAINGFIFTQMQEPGFMLFIASLIGLRWQEVRIDRLLAKHDISG